MTRSRLSKKKTFDLILLDEMMPGKDGLTTLEEIKDLRPHLPVVMVTKSQEESLMDDAIGSKIDDYLVKPVNPSQILLVIKRLLDSKKIISSSSMRRYVQEINKFNQRLYGPMEPEDWFDAARIIAEWNVEMDDSTDEGLKQTHDGTKKEWNNEFTKYILGSVPGLAARRPATAALARCRRPVCGAATQTETAGAVCGRRLHAT